MQSLTQRISDKIQNLKQALSNTALQESDKQRLQAELIECQDDALLLRQYQIEQMNTGTTNK